ncbi:two-component system response regulator [Candidatus Auribacterota bacterium]
MKPKHILILNDDHDSLLPLTTILGHSKYKVTNVKQEAEALKLITSSKKDSYPINFVLIYINTPDLKGAGLIKKLADLKIYLPTIIMTDHTDRETKKSLIQSGYTSYIDKSFSSKELFKFINFESSKNKEDK